MALLGRSPPEDGERLYLNQGLVVAIFGVKMCGAVVAKVHSNHNPEESSDLGLFFFRFYALCNRSAGTGTSARLRRLAQIAIRPAALPFPPPIVLP
jgi:hypothetical protein